MTIVGNIVIYCNTLFVDMRVVAHRCHIFQYIGARNVFK